MFRLDLAEDSHGGGRSPDDPPVSFLEGACLSRDWKEAAAGRQDMPMGGE
jgi:hypothetical protein